MCGIVGYIGKRHALDQVLSGLERLEYRGYDSAGVAWLSNDNLRIVKAKGRVKKLQNKLKKTASDIHLAVGHTRWATHGPPSELNAHPHIDCQGNFAVVHNGIIENYHSLKEWLTKKGHKFSSETDTEILAHLVEELSDGDLLSTVRKALQLVKGTYGLAFISRQHPDEIVIARQGSPLAVGLGKDELIIASDMTPIIPLTRQVIYLNDGSLVRVRNNGYEVIDMEDNPVTVDIQQIEEKLDVIEKGGYKHFMLKEIMEQPQSLEAAMSGRLNVKKKVLKLGGIENYLDDIKAKKRIVLTACGTSWHACLAAEYFMEEFLQLPTEVEYASEFRYRSAPLDSDTLLIAVSQSGETADTLAAVEKAKQAGVFTLGVCNVVGSTIARATKVGVYLHAGPEIGVASTKAFTAQLTVLLLMTFYLAESLGKRKKVLEFYEELSEIPDKIKLALETNDQVKKIASRYKQAENFLYLGRGYNFPTALEGALKLKEISYIHAEGYPAAEMKHGPIALVDDNMPVVFIISYDETYDKVISNIEEVRARGGRLIIIANEGDVQVKKFSDDVIYIPQVSSQLSPLLTVIPLQLLAYHIAEQKGLDVDKPRNLAKSVTVE